MWKIARAVGESGGLQGGGGREKVGQWEKGMEGMGTERKGERRTHSCESGPKALVGYNTHHKNLKHWLFTE